MEDKKDDDEISIDLSKIKSFFKKKKEHAHAPIEAREEKHEHAMEAHKEESKNDDEINIDFGKIKNLFKAKKSEAHEEKEYKHSHHAT